MSRSESLVGEMRTGLLSVATVHDGPVVLVPGAMELASVMGISKGNFYHYGTDYTEKIEMATGLHVIESNGNAKGALVLGRDSKVRECTETDLGKVTLNTMLYQASKLSLEERAHLLALLATRAED